MAASKAFSVLFGLCASQVEAWSWWQEPALRRLQMSDTMSCEEILQGYEMQGCCGNPGKPFAMPTGRRLQGTTGAEPVYCKDVKDAYRQMKCCSKTSAGGGGMYSIDFFTDSSGCSITFPDYGTCVVPGLGGKCCGYYVGLIERGTPEADYAGLLEAATGDGTCGGEEMIGFNDLDFLRCVRGVAGSQDSSPQPASPQERLAIFLSDNYYKDGTLSVDEFLDASAKAAGFENIDAWRKVMTFSDAAAKENLDQIDTNKDGVVTREEVSAIFQAPQDSSGDELMPGITFKADSSGGCGIIFPQGDSSYTCTAPVVGEKCCGYFVDLIKKNTPIADYEGLFTSAVADGTCVIEDLGGLADATFQSCLSGES